MAALVLKNFVPWPTALAAGIVEALAGPHGNYVMAARVHILSKVCRQEDGWNGLALDEFRTTPSELGAAIHRSPQYASRVLQVLKKEGWIRSTGVDGVWAIVPSRVYESVADLVMRKKRHTTDKKQHSVLVSTPVVIPGVVDGVLVVVGSDVVDGVAATPVKPNGSAGSQPPQESRVPEGKSSSSLSSSSDDDDGDQGKDEPCPVNQIDGDLLEDQIKEFLCYWNDKAPAIGLKGSPLVSPALRKAATRLFNEGLTLQKCWDGLVWISGFKKNWWPENQPDYRPEDFLARADEYAAKQAAKQRENVEEPPTKSSATSPTKKTPKKKPVVSAEVLPSILGVHWPVIQEVIGLFAGKENLLEDGPALKAILEEGRQTPEGLLRAAKARVNASSGSRQYIKNLGEWIRIGGYLADPKTSAVSNIEAANHPRAATDANYAMGMRAAGDDDKPEITTGPSPLVARLTSTSIQQE